MKQDSGLRGQFKNPQSRVAPSPRLEVDTLQKVDCR